MATGILGRKVGMTQIYDVAGRVVPVTVIEAGPCDVLQVRSKERDGYEAVQLGFLDVTRRRAPRSQRGHVAKLDSKRARRQLQSGVELRPKANCEPKKFIRELRGASEGLEVGTTVEVGELGKFLFHANATCCGELDEGVFPDSLKKEFQGTGLVAANPTVSVRAQAQEWVIAFEGHSERYVLRRDGDQLSAYQEIVAVDVTGVSKGRGFSGAMKRHNFAGQRASHGVKKCHRHLGGTGCSAYPGRLFKGKKMPGRYGGARSTTRNLKVIDVDRENHLLVVRGSVPGPNGGYLIISATNKF